MANHAIVSLSILAAIGAMPYPVLFFLIFVGAAVGMLIAGAARAARDRADAAAAEEPDRRTWDDTDLYDIE
jgi:uncharacterized integral membrane protein